MWIENWCRKHFRFYPPFGSMLNLDCCWICLQEFSVAKSCLTLCNPMDCSLPGFSARVIFQARILEWVAISSSQDRTHVSCISRRILYHRTTWWICLLFQYVTSGFMLSFISSVKGEEQFFFCFLPPFSLGFPCGSASKESRCLQCWRPVFDPWVGRILWRRKWQPTPVFWSREFHGLSMGSQKVGHEWATFNFSFSFS